MVHLLAGADRVGEAMRGVLVEVESGGAEGEVHVEDEHVLPQVLRDRPGDVVRHGRTARAAFGRHKGDGTPDRRRAFDRKQVGNGRDDLAGARGQDDIFGDARADQLAIEHDVIGVAENDETGRRVADLGEASESRGNFGGRQAGLDDDQVGRRIGLIGLDGSFETSIVGGQRDLRHPPVVDGRLDQLRRLGMFAEGLDGDAGNEPHCPSRPRRPPLSAALGILAEEAHHASSFSPAVPVPLSAARSLSAR